MNPVSVQLSVKNKRESNDEKIYCTGNKTSGIDACVIMSVEKLICETDYVVGRIEKNTGYGNKGKNVIPFVFQPEYDIYYGKTTAV